MRPSRLAWMSIRYPLAMELRMSRQDCKSWMKKMGYSEPPRSACVGCPYHSDDEWRFIKEHSFSEWLDAVKFDESIRKSGGLSSETFLHRSCVPLAEVDLVTLEERGSLGYGPKNAKGCAVYRWITEGVR